MSPVPPPIVLSISPTSTAVRLPSQETITVNGTNFQNGAVTGFDPAGIAVVNTTWVSSTQLTVLIEIETVANGGPAIGSTFSITVINPDGGIATKANVLTVN
jgi:hypothetical protein